MVIVISYSITLLIGYKLLIIIHNAIYKVHHRLGYLTDVGGFLRPVFICKELIIDTVPRAVVLHLQIIEKLVILREVLGCFLQTTDAKAFVARRKLAFPRLLIRIAELMDELIVLHAAAPLGDVSHDLIAHGCEDIRREPIGTDGEEAVTGLDMEIITSA